MVCVFLQDLQYGFNHNNSDIIVVIDELSIAILNI